MCVSIFTLLLPLLSPFPRRIEWDSTRIIIPTTVTTSMPAMSLWVLLCSWLLILKAITYNSDTIIPSTHRCHLTVDIAMVVTHTYSSMFYYHSLLSTMSVITLWWPKALWSTRAPTSGRWCGRSAFTLFSWSPMNWWVAETIFVPKAWHKCYYLYNRP